jgi:hypothetical protein
MFKNGFCETKKTKHIEAPQVKRAKEEREKDICDD